MEEIEPIPVTIVTAQLELVQAWRTLLLVATSCHVSCMLVMVANHYYIIGGGISVNRYRNKTHHIV